eukprot:scaffold115961_cov72-Phaeocystis_antarctica.AAC.1
MSARSDQCIDHNTLEADVRQMEHGVRPELDQVPIEDLRCLNRGRGVHPRAERAQDASQDCSAAEALEYRLELCMNYSAAPPSELCEHWPAVRQMEMRVTTQEMRSLLYTSVNVKVRLPRPWDALAESSRDVGPKMA